jgi:hypothetical protein
LINLEVGSELNEIIFLIDSRAALSSLAFHPPVLQLSPDKLLVSGVKGKGFNVPLFKETSVKYKDKQRKIIFLLYMRQGLIS